MSKSNDEWFKREHDALETQLHQHLLAVMGLDFAAAELVLRDWRGKLAQHIEIENTRLLPHVPDDARWPARLYLKEHERIGALADDYLATVQAVAKNPPDETRARHEMALRLIDSAHALRHLLDHHHQREEMALALELSPELQRAAWAGD